MLLGRRHPVADLSIDLGTANTVVCAAGDGVVLDEPSVITLRDARGGPEVVAVGGRARAMLGRNPEHLVAVRPLRDGVIADFGAATLMLAAFTRRCWRRRLPRQPRVLVSLPHEVTPVEREAVREAAREAGARTVTLVDEPLAAALGASLPVLEARASMIVDVGGGTTEVAVVSLGGIVSCRAVRLGGDHMDVAIAQCLRWHYGIVVGERTAEEVKLRLASALPDAPPATMRVAGRDVATGIPRTVDVGSGTVYEAICAIVHRIVDTTREALFDLPPELAGDVVDMGITLAGGGALLRGLDRLLALETGVPVTVDSAPLATVARGGRAIMETGGLLDRLTLPS
jgi:rod shape-determining protein MreB